MNARFVLTTLEPLSILTLFRWCWSSLLAYHMHHGVFGGRIFDLTLTVLVHSIV